MKLQNLAIATIGLAGGLLLHAQPPPPDFTELKAYLNLSDAQVSSFHDLNRAQRDAARSVSEDLRSKHQAMNSAMRSGSTDVATINSNAQAIKAGEQKMQSIRQQYQTQAVATLTADQQNKLKALTDAAALMPSVHQASMLGLIAAPQGQGPRGGGGPRGPGGATFHRGGPGGPPPSPQE